MAEAQVDSSSAQDGSEIQLESGTYEIIRGRLDGYGKELRNRLDQLNDARKEVFGSIETKLLSTERVSTEHNCVPRDMVPVGSSFLFGYNVQFGLKTETHLADVFSVYDFRDGTFHPTSLDLLKDERFHKDFKEIYRYYKNAVFVKFFSIGPHVHMVFRVGKSVTDIKSFKWLLHLDQLTYVDNRSDHEVRFPPQHEFEWKRTHRDLHQSGQHPHISIEDQVFVETVGGDLTIKVENNTKTGVGVYSEPVDDPDQTLDDAEIYYSSLGNIILLKIKPYQERDFRYIVFNQKLQSAKRLDAIEHACVLLPDDHGLIFSSGYYLQRGEYKTFDFDLRDMLFEKQIVSPNGEDYLFVFYNRFAGVYVLLKYNLIERCVDTPVICHGYSFFPGGELLCFRGQDDPQKHHALQIWQTPFVGLDFVPHTQSDSFLYKIGNRDIVRGMAECHEVLTLIGKEETYTNLYLDIVREANDIADSYFWVDKADAFNLKEVLLRIRDTAEGAIEEYEKVVRVRQNTKQESDRVQNHATEVIAAINHRRFDNINEYVQSLSDLRVVRGEVISVRDLRYADLGLVDSIEKEVSDYTDKLARRCVTFLLKKDSLAPYIKEVAEEHGRIDSLQKVTDATKVEEMIGKSAAELEMLIEIVSNLKIDDATHRTSIIDSISSIFSQVNHARAALKKKKKELLSVEGVAEFNSQIKLLNQAVVNYLDVCDSPLKCEEYLTKVMISVEELEGRFAEFDEFVEQLSEKREEVYAAFESRKLSLIESRNKRANSLLAAADRILKGVKSRVESFDSVTEINGYFASDLMIEKIRDIVDKLTDLEDTVKVDDIQSRLKTIREDAVRQLKDRQELYVDGKNIIQFGNHKFSVNVQALDLTTVLRDKDYYFHLTGTNFFELISDEQFDACRDLWSQEYISENKTVYRAEFLAFSILRSLESDNELEPNDVLKFSDEETIEYVQKYMGPRYSEGYVKGVHDRDAAFILKHLIDIDRTAGMLRHDAISRSLAVLYWNYFGDKRAKALMHSRVKGFGAISELFDNPCNRESYHSGLVHLIAEFVEATNLFASDLVPTAADYLVDELTKGERFVISRTASNLFDQFNSFLSERHFLERYQESTRAVHKHLPSYYSLIRNWVQAYVDEYGASEFSDYVDETSVLLLDGKVNSNQVFDANLTRVIDSMAGSHGTIDGSTYRLEYNQFVHKMRHHCDHVAERFASFQLHKKELVQVARDRLRLEEFRPRVLTSFVRNKLIDTVYLPLVGDNLAKQIGSAGESKRTDRMGLLLLVSPPGYGKTTLMEYIANRLGLIFMKINGPAIGHDVKSLDPLDAPNAGAREEIEKLNLSLEMGDNVMLYVDDIQHCNPEFLQKFISLCDAQRKIEGVYKGQSRTYDLRGKKVAVVMAGNPYTESGDKFQIPDMLSNRADIYNLGEIIGDSLIAFEMSYLENSLTSNPVLAKLTSRSQKDIYAIMDIADRGSAEGIDLEGNFAPEELDEAVKTMAKLMRVRDVILQVNREYIRSAAQSDAYRTEPPFKLQGSYRNMNRIAEKVLPIMNDAELETLIVSNYENDVQTLTSDAEANLLKFKELIEVLTPEEKRRWEDIKSAFVRNTKLKGIDTSDKVGQVIAQLSGFGDGLESIRRVMSDGIGQLAEDTSAPTLQPEIREVIEHLSGLRESLDRAREYVAAESEKVEKDSMSEMSQGLHEQLGGLRSGLDAIRKTIQKGVSEVTEAGFKVEGIAPGVSDNASSRSEPSRPPIQIVNKVPTEFLKVVQRQFDILRKWIEPLHQSTQTQTAEWKRLREVMETCMDDYSLLADRLKKMR